MLVATIRLCEVKSGQSAECSTLAPKYEPLNENERLQWKVENTIHTFFTALMGGMVGTLIAIMLFLLNQR